MFEFEEGAEAKNPALLSNRDVYLLELAGWTPEVGDEQGGLACCSSWGHRVRHD